MKTNKLLTALAASALVVSQGAVADKGGDNWSISGWINEAVTYYDDGDNSDIVQISDNGNTLGSRITLAGETELPNTSMNAGFEVILEPRLGGLGWGTTDATFTDSPGNNSLNVLGSSVFISGSFGKLTLGEHSTPTDNIAVLEDPSLTLWASISPIFRGNGVYALTAASRVAFTTTPIVNTEVAITDLRDGISQFDIDDITTTGPILETGLRAVGVNSNTALAFVTFLDTGTGVTGEQLIEVLSNTGEFLNAPIRNARIGSFLSCMGVEGLRDALGIGIDCNGIYRRGIRYDLPALGPVTVAIGHANDDIYDIAAKYKGSMGDFNAQVALGYTINQGSDAAVSAYNASETQTFQMQAGLMHTGTGIFGSVAYQFEEAEAQVISDFDRALTNSLDGSIQDDTNAWWLKVGVKRAFNSLGYTSFAIQYGQYNDQYGVEFARLGVNGSEVERIGFEVNQYFGDRLIIYGVWEQLDTSADCGNNAIGNLVCGAINGGDELNMFTTGLTFFF